MTARAYTYEYVSELAVCLGGWDQCIITFLLCLFIFPQITSLPFYALPMCHQAISHGQGSHGHAFRFSTFILAKAYLGNFVTCSARQFCTGFRVQKSCNFFLDWDITRPVVHTESARPLHLLSVLLPTPRTCLFSINILCKKYFIFFVLPLF